MIFLEILKLLDYDENADPSLKIMATFWSSEKVSFKVNRVVFRREELIQASIDRF